MAAHIKVPKRELDTPGAQGPFWVMVEDKSTMPLMLVCPNGHRRFYSWGPSWHTVNDEGKISPSTVCEDCGWHVFVRLDGMTAEDLELLRAAGA